MNRNVKHDWLFDPAVPPSSYHYELGGVAFRFYENVSPLIFTFSRLNRIATLLARCLCFAIVITGYYARLATAGWLDLMQTGFAPVRFIALYWAHHTSLRDFQKRP